MSNDEQLPDFKTLGLNDSVLAALLDSGYETPSTIQAMTIPIMMAGRDLIGQAQTGTGKTAAFALPLLHRLSKDGARPQVLVLTPTRELAIQVAASFSRYAAHMKWAKVVAIYGGQDYGVQIRALERGVHVVIGTPGRVMDHLRRGTLNLSGLSGLVLDEADEMLRMGFIDDVEWILAQSPPERQTALFSATMPPEIRKIAAKHLHSPEQVIIKTRATAAETIVQKAWIVGGISKLEALSRMLEVTDTDGVIVFVKTRNGAVELADELTSRGFQASALNGDMPQKQREQTIDRLKAGRLNILVATDVAARGLDVERLSHVFNYDAPFDAETYVHRIGRTGRAGRTGESILFVSPREKRLLYGIERSSRQRIELIHPPTIEQINRRRVARFHERILETIAQRDLSLFKEMVQTCRTENGLNEDDVSAALAFMLQGDAPFLLKKEPRHPQADRTDVRPSRDSSDGPSPRSPKAPRNRDAASRTWVLYRLEVGRDHGVQAGNIVGAIANESGLDSSFIGRIDIRGDHSIVELPEGMPKDVFAHLRKVWICERQLRISPADAPAPDERPAVAPAPKKEKRAKKQKQKTAR